MLNALALPDLWYNLLLFRWETSILPKTSTLKLQRQIWDILHGVSSIGILFTRKILAWYDK